MNVYSPYILKICLNLLGATDGGRFRSYSGDKLATRLTELGGLAKRSLNTSLDHIGVCVYLLLMLMLVSVIN